jgi:hypothetical protein
MTLERLLSLPHVRIRLTEKGSKNFRTGLAKQATPHTLSHMRKDNYPYALTYARACYMSHYDKKEGRLRYACSEV